MAGLLGVGLGLLPDDSRDAGGGADEDSVGAELGPPFSRTSAFNTPIGPDAQIDPDSAAMVRVLAGKKYATAQVYNDTPAVYYADLLTPRYALNCTKDWGSCDLEREKVPIPKGAEASPGVDANMVVIDWSTRKAYEFYKYRNDYRTVSWGAVLPIDGSGTGNGRTDPGRYGAVGAGVSRLAGIIRTYEVRQGYIDHALVGPTGFSCKSTFRYPAVKTDGWSTASQCIPEGARVQLDPSVDCGSLPGARPWEKMVCRALQRYGWYNIDNGAKGEPGFGIQFENPAGEANTYRAMGLRDYAHIRHIPLTKLRVLKAWNSFSGGPPAPQ